MKVFIRRPKPKNECAMCGTPCYGVCKVCIELFRGAMDRTIFMAPRRRYSSYEAIND